MSQRRLHEMLTVTIGAIGVPDTATGIVPVTLDLDSMSDLQIGKALAEGYRQAHRDAVDEFGPKLTAAWAASPDRIANGDDTFGEEESTP